MNIEKIKDWSYENLQMIIIVLIVLIIGVSAYNYNNEGGQECEEFDLVDKFEKNEVSWGYIIYYSDGRIEKSKDLPACIKLKK